MPWISWISPHQKKETFLDGKIDRIRKNRAKLLEGAATEAVNRSRSRDRDRGARGRGRTGVMLATCLDAHLVACPPRLRRALVEAGFNNVHDVCHLSAMDLAKEIGASPEDAQQVIDLAKSKAVGACMGAPITFRTALDLFEVRLFPSPSSPRTKAHHIPPLSLPLTSNVTPAPTKKNK